MAANTNLGILLEKLHISDEAIPILQELKSAIQSIHPTYLVNHITPLSFLPIFDRLNSSNSAEIELCCDILTLMMNALPPATVVTELSQQLNKALLHPDINIMNLALKQLLRCAAATVGGGVQCECVSADPGYVNTLIHLMGAERLGVAAQATQILCNIGADNSSRARLLSPPHVGRMEEVMLRSDTVRYRVYEMVVGVSVSSSSALRDMHDAGLLPRLLAELTSGMTQLTNGTGQNVDMLVLLNCVEMTTTLVTAKHGLVYADECGILPGLHTVLANHGRLVEDNPLLTLVIPGMMKLFGHASVHDPLVVCGERYPQVLPTCFTLLGASPPDPTILPVALDTVALVATTDRGKRTLANYGEGMCGVVMPSLGRIISTGAGDSEARLRALHSLASCITDTNPTDPPEESGVAGTCELWFSHLVLSPARATPPTEHGGGGVESRVQRGVELVFSLCRQPFTELRCAALGVCAALATQTWGCAGLLTCPGLVEHLLDRNTESSAAGREAKYGVVGTLVSPRGQSVLPAHLHLALCTYHNQGPHYVDITTEVATEDA